MNTKSILAAIALALALPFIANAAECQGICSPLSADFSTIPRFIAGFLQVMVQVGLPVIALFMLIAGFKFVSAGGSSEGINKAKENFKWVIIGSIFILGAWVIANLIGNTVGSVIGTEINFS
jgi:hypothetical protein